MCGRFVLFSNLDVLKDILPIDRVDFEPGPSYNIAPGQRIVAIVRDDEQNVLTRLHWGLVPFWAKEKSSSYKTINARAETVRKKPSFRSAFKKRRCLIPADGFYEWKKMEGRKQPFHLRPESGKPFAFAGIWEIWRKDEGDELFSCAIITTKAAGPVEEVHHRMPVILAPESYGAWLDGETSPEKAEQILRENNVTNIELYPVSLKVNSARNNSPDCVKPLQENHVPGEFGFETPNKR